MTREEFIWQRLRDERAQYRVLFLVCSVAAGGAAILGIAMVIAGGIAPALTVFCLGATIFGYGAVSRSAYQSLDKALREIEEDPEGLSYPEDYSVATGTAIEKAQLPAKTYRQQVLAYGFSAILMVLGGALVVGISGGLFGSDFEGAERYVFAILGSLLLAGGVLVGILAGQAARNARMAKAFESTSTDG